MAETFTSDNTPDAEVLTSDGEVNLSPEEQDSLQVGEKMVAEQEGLLAGKYKSAEDLEAAYLSLQQKLGEKDGVQEGQEAEEVKAEETKEEEKPAESTPAMALITEASDEYYKNDGVLSEKTIEKFSSMSSSDLVNAYIEAQKQNPQLNANQATTNLSDADVNQVQNAAGGLAEYNKVIDWAGSNLDNKSIQAFDSVVDSGNIAAINIAFQGLKSKYIEANGYEGRMLTGKAPKKQGDVYRSQAELVAAMSDPRYDNDPAYRADVIEKLSQSDVTF